MGLTDKLQKMIFGKKAVSTEKKKTASAPKEKDTSKLFTAAKKIAKKPSKEKGAEDSIEDLDLEGQSFTEDEAVSKFSQGLVGVQDLIAPAAIEVDFSHMKMNEKFFRTLFVLTYPNMLPTNWMSGVINLSHNLSVSTFYYPIDSRIVMQKLKRKISEFQATLNMAVDEGKLPDPGVKIALDDAQRLQELLAKNEEKYFHYALYITLQADSLKELNDINAEVESTLGTLGIVAKPASLEMEQGFQSCIPTGMDNLYKTRNMSTDAISATFPFVTSSLTMDSGVLYGLNRHNNSLVVFDRFSLENANSVVFATSGAGKSYMVKLEIYRSMMMGAKVIVIDPEREYEALCQTVGGSYISFSQTGGDKINPFDLSGVYEEGENELSDKRLFLLGLLQLMLGGVSPEEKALLDKAIGLTYQEKGITEDPSTQSNTPPLMEDLYKILKGMAEEEAHRLATRLEMYIKGAAGGVFDRPTSVDLNNAFTVFSLQELSDELRPIAMYMMLDYIWTRIRKDRSKRILVVDEAWYMMQHEDSARFLYWFAKRARKYFLGVTTITQDVDDFLDSKYGKAIVSNSSIKILLKQNTSAIDKIQQVFKLSDGERLILLNSAVGEGLFFAGQNHVMLQVVSSEHEHNIVSTDPREAAKRKELLEKRLAISKGDQKTKELISESGLSKGQILDDKKPTDAFKVSLEDKELLTETTEDVKDLEEVKALEKTSGVDSSIVPSSVAQQSVNPEVEIKQPATYVIPEAKPSVPTMPELPPLVRKVEAVQPAVSNISPIDKAIIRPSASFTNASVVSNLNQTLQPLVSTPPVQSAPVNVQSENVFPEDTVIDEEMVQPAQVIKPAVVSQNIPVERDTEVPQSSTDKVEGILAGAMDETPSPANELQNAVDFIQGKNEFPEELAQQTISKNIAPASLNSQEDKVLKPDDEISILN